MIVCPDAIIDLGGGPLDESFQFAYSIIFVLYGQLAFLFPGFRLPFNSQFNCYPGSYVNVVGSFIITIYDQTTGVSNGAPITLNGGPGLNFYLSVDVNGVQSTSDVGMCFSFYRF
jgi:hypothetical protein